MSQSPRVSRVARFGLVVSDNQDAELFYKEAFGFVVVEQRQGDAAFSNLLGLPGVSSRQTLMRLGQQEVMLLSFEPAGKAYPPGSTSTDLWFQHFAIITSDMAAAYAKLQATGRYRPISEGGPVQLPKSSGGATAFKFRDLDGHPLEFLAFPPDKAPDAWRTKAGSDLFLGIDHSAISIGDTAASVDFLTSCFGLKQSMQTENVGPEQARMDAVPDARVTVTGLAPASPPPHVELLDYAVGTRRPISDGTKSNDIAATFFVLETEDLEPILEALIARDAHFVSPGPIVLADGARAIAVLDSDGHRFIVEERRTG